MDLAVVTPCMCCNGILWPASEDYCMEEASYPCSYHWEMKKKKNIYKGILWPAGETKQLEKQAISPQDYSNVNTK